MFHKKSLFLLFIIFVISGFFTAFAAELKITPSISIKEEYNDNLFYTEKDRKDDFITIVSPSLGITSRTEKGLLDISAGLDWRDYKKTNSLDFIVQKYRMDGKYQFDPKLGISGSLGVLKDFSPDRDLTEAGLVTKAIKRSKYTGTLGIEKTFFEKTKGNLSLNYERSEYRHDPEYVDYNFYGTDLGVVYSITPKASGRLSLGYNFYEQRRVEQDYYYGMLGFGYSLQEKWSLFIDGGLSYMDTELETTPGTKTNKKGTGWVGRSVLSYKGEKDSANFIFYRRIAPGTGIYGTSERNFFSVDFSRRFTYEFSGGVAVSYITNRAKKGKYSLSEIDQKTFLFTPQVRYNFTENMFVEGSYSFSRLSDIVGDTVSKRNLFMINFTIRHPIEKGI